ncbi:MAG: universal stress protein [Halieaceae bacterium]|jgi:nucleotide-binding universal stress UspA family protein|nr:universal stress protein [Halieaceae bacterium]
MDLSNKVLACVDHSRFADYVTDYAAWAATQLNAPMELLHIIDRQEAPASGEDHSGAIGFDAQAQLLDKLSSEDELRTRAARESGRALLTRLRDRASESGAPDVDIRQRYGELEETLREQEDGVGLIVLGRRGQAAETTQRDLGRNVERLVRALKHPILTVTEDYTPPQRVMFAFDGSAVTRRGVELLAHSALCRSLPILLLMSGKAGQDERKKLDRAATRLSDAGLAVSAELIPGDAETVIARTSKEREIDLLIMGAFGHSPLRSLLFGSKTADLLRSAKIPTLLLR